jgi:pimeloyl-ACP methyl ester carboxylesterase
MKVFEFRATQAFHPRGYKLRTELRSDPWESFHRPEVRKFVVRMCAGYQGTLPRLRQLFPTVRIPALLLWGERDKHSPVAQGEKFVELMRCARLEVIPRSGHWMAVNLAEDVSARIERFLG